jgi:hypothetical protein
MATFWANAQREAGGFTENMKRKVRGMFDGKFNWSLLYLWARIVSFGDHDGNAVLCLPYPVTGIGICAQAS